MLDDARHAGNPQVAERIGAVASVVEDEPLLRVNGVQEVAAESHRKPDYASEVARGRVVLNIFSFHLHGAEKAHVV